MGKAEVSKLCAGYFFSYLISIFGNLVLRKSNLFEGVVYHIKEKVRTKLEINFKSVILLPFIFLLFH